MLAPYEINVTTPDGVEYTLIRFLDDIGLSDEDAKTAASDLAQAIIDKIATPSPDTLSVSKGVIHPPGYPVRFANAEARIGQ